MRFKCCLSHSRVFVNTSARMRACLKSCMVTVLLVFAVKGLLTYLDLFGGISVLQRVRDRTFLMKRNFVSARMEDHLQQTELMFQSKVKKFHESYYKYFKPKMTASFKIPTLSQSRSSFDVIRPYCESKPFLLIVVHSAPLNVKKRLAIRYSWASDEYYSSNSKSFGNVKTIFVVGRSKIHGVNEVLRDEAKKYKDLLITNFTDSYRILSSKTMFALNWSYKNCLPEYLLKTDDDCLVNVFNVMKYLSQQNTGQLYTGRIQWFMPANRDASSKFYIPEKDYGELLLPPYASGGGYILSGELIPPLLNASNSRRMIPNEDANIGILMHAINISPVENMNILPYIYCNESIWIRPTCDFLQPFVLHGIQNYAQLWVHYNVKVLNIVKGICQQSMKYRKLLDPPLYCPTDNS